MSPIPVPRLQAHLFRYLKDAVGHFCIQELVSQFNTLLESDRHIGLLVTITSESLQPVTLLTPSTPGASLSANLDSLLAPHVKPDQALYVLLRRYETSPFLTAATYVPDAAPVRQKMLFASTRLTLVRELGSEHFRDTLFATDPAELSVAGLARHDAHAALEAPLTEEERTLGEVRRAEQEAGAGTGTREIHLSKSLAMPVSEEAIGAIKELAAGEGRDLVMLRINPENEVVELVANNSRPASIPELVQAISPSEPRFTFYRFKHSQEGSDSSPVLFFYTCPMTPGNKAIKYRMMYPLMKRAVLDIATKETGLEIDKKFEVEEPNEITEQSVLGELHPRSETRKAFSKPRRPGR